MVQTRIDEDHLFADVARQFLIQNLNDELNLTKGRQVDKMNKYIKYLS